MELIEHWEMNVSLCFIMIFCYKTYQKASILFVHIRWDHIQILACKGYQNHIRISNYSNIRWTLYIQRFLVFFVFNASPPACLSLRDHITLGCENSLTSDVFLYFTVPFF